jgi:hypothetical protein
MQRASVHQPVKSVSQSRAIEKNSVNNLLQSLVVFSQCVVSNGRLMFRSSNLIDEISWILKQRNALSGAPKDDRFHVPAGVDNGRCLAAKYVGPWRGSEAHNLGFSWQSHHDKTRVVVSAARFAWVVLLEVHVGIVERVNTIAIRGSVFVYNFAYLLAFAKRQQSVLL